MSADTDPDVEHYGTGPGRRQCTPGPVIDVYADGAIDRPCANCGAEPLSFCLHPSGVPRKLPCHNR